MERGFKNTQDVAHVIYSWNRDKGDRSFDDNVIQNISNKNYQAALTHLEDIANSEGRTSSKRKDMAKTVLSIVKNPDGTINEAAMQSILTYTYGAAEVKDVYNKKTG